MNAGISSNLRVTIETNRGKETLVFDTAGTIVKSLEVDTPEYTIIRLPFYLHGPKLHTICRLNSDKVDVWEDS